MRPRVFCMERLDPVFASRHLVPDLVKLAGGIDKFTRERGESVGVSWDDLVAWNPEVLVIMPSGFNLQQTMKEIWNLFGPYAVRTGKSGSDSAGSGSRPRERFFELEAVRNGRVYAVDANSYFAEADPRVVEAAELLARLIHPSLFTDDPLPPEFANVFQPVDIALLQGAFEPEKDYYMEDGAFVITGSYLRRRGYCCGSGCRHCPYPA